MLVSGLSFSPTHKQTAILTCLRTAVCACVCQCVCARVRMCFWNLRYGVCLFLIPATMCYFMTIVAQQFISRWLTMQQAVEFVLHFGSPVWLWYFLLLLIITVTCAQIYVRAVARYARFAPLCPCVSSQGWKYTVIPRHIEVHLLRLRCLAE